MPIFPVGWGLGNNTSKPRHALETGEMTQSTGGWYPPGVGDTTIAKVLGRTQFGEVLSGVAIDGLRLCEFDNTNDRLVAYAASGYFGADSTGLTGSFSLLTSGITFNSEFKAIAPSGTLSATHYNDRWFLANGKSENIVLEDDLSSRPHGMQAPVLFDQALIYKSVSGSGIYPSAEADTGIASTISSPENAWDVTDGIYANVQAVISGAAYHTYTGFPEQTSLASGMYLNIRYRVYGSDLWTPGGPLEQDGDYTPPDYDGVTPKYGFEYSQDGGATWNTGLALTTWATKSVSDYQISLSGTTTSGLQFRLQTDVAGLLSDNATYTLRLYLVSVLGIDGYGDPNVAPFQTTSGMYYGITEYDDNRKLESPITYLDSAIAFDADDLANGMNSLVITMPAGSVNENATHLRVYRTTDAGAAPQDFGEIGKVAISDTAPVFVDQFTTDKDTVAFPKYRMLTVVGANGGVTYYDLDVPPATFKHVTQFQGSIVGIDASNPRQMSYSPPGTPESFPDPYRIKSFSLEESDSLVATAPVGDSLLVFTSEAVLELRGLPLVEADGRFNLPDITKLAGQPGLVSSRAVTPVSRNGSPACAWVSPVGVHITNGVTAERLTDELDWDNTVNAANLSTAILHWDRERQLLVFHYDADGSGFNNRSLFFHLAHMKSTGYPKITGPHYGQAAAIALGTVNNDFRVFSAHPTNGSVYLEWNGSTDESNAYDGSGTVPMHLKTARFTRDQEYEDYEIFKASLRHSDWGAGQAATVSVVYGRDTNLATSGVLSKSVSLANYGGTEFFIGRSMEWAEFEILHTGSASGSIYDIRNTSQPAGGSGSR